MQMKVKNIPKSEALDIFRNNQMLHREIFLCQGLEDHAETSLQKG